MPPDREIKQSEGVQIPPDSLYLVPCLPLVNMSFEQAKDFYRRSAQDKEFRTQFVWEVQKSSMKFLHKGLPPILRPDIPSLQFKTIELYLRRSVQWLDGHIRPKPKKKVSILWHGKTQLYWVNKEVLKEYRKAAASKWTTANVSTALSLRALEAYQSTREAGQDARHQAVWEAVIALDTEEQASIILSLEGYTNEEAAEMLGVGLGAYKYRLGKAKKQLLESLRHHPLFSRKSIAVPVAREGVPHE